MRRSWLGWALAGSLAVNLMVAGAVGGALLSRDGGGGRGAAGGGPPEIGVLARALDANGRRTLRQGLRGDSGLRAGRAAMAERRVEVLAALRSEPFAPERLTEALAAQRAVQSGLADRGFDMLAEVIGSMTPEARAAYADRVEEALARRGRPNGRAGPTGTRDDASPSRP